MSDNRPSLNERLAVALRMGQDPVDRLWSAIYALVVIILLVGGITVVYAEETRHSHSDIRELGFQRGSVDCLSVVVDNDRTFGLPAYCRLDDIVIYYPPEICDSFFPDAESCGDEWEEE